MYRPLLLLAVLLTACAPPAPTALTAPPVANATATALPLPSLTTKPSDTPRPTDTTTPTEAPRPTSTATNTPISTVPPTETAAPTIDPATLDDLQRGYMALLLLESSLGALDELAVQLQAGTVDGLEAMGVLIASAAILGQVKELVDAEPITRSLGPAWVEARQAAELAGDIVRRWFDDEVTSEDVPGLLGPAAEHADKALQLAGRQMTKEYGVTEPELIEVRQTAEASFRAIFETPTPAANGDSDSP